MRRVLIAGCGDVGERLAALLLAQGAEVFGLRRRVQAVNRDPLAGELHWLEGDLTQPSTLARLPEDLDTVFFTAAAPAFTATAYQETHIDGLNHLLAALSPASARPGRVIFVSSTAVYGQQNGDWVDEQSLAASDHFSGSTLREAEQCLLDAPIPGIVVRFGGIYGPGRTRLPDSIRGGQASLSEGAPRYINLIHADDCARALVHVARLPAPQAVYLGVDHCPVDRNELMVWLAGELGVPAPMVGEEAVALPGARFSNKRCGSQRLRASGFEFLYPSFREGYVGLLG